MNSQFSIRKNPFFLSRILSQILKMDKFTQLCYDELSNTDRTG